MQVVKTVTSPVRCPFLLFAALCDPKVTTHQRYRRTADGRHAVELSASRKKTTTKLKRKTGHRNTRESSQSPVNAVEHTYCTFICTKPFGLFNGDILMAEYKLRRFLSLSKIWLESIGPNRAWLLVVFHARPVSFW